MREPSESFVEWHCRECSKGHNEATVAGTPNWDPPAGWTHGHDRFARAKCPACSGKETP